MQTGICHGDVPFKERINKSTNHYIVQLLLLLIVFIYIALFSALEQTHCARMRFYMSEWIFIAHF